jgi:hypothetical protein
MAIESEEWLTKRQASARMGVGERQVLQLAGKGVLRRRRERDEVTKQHVVKVHAADVQKYIDSAKPAQMEVAIADPRGLAIVRSHQERNENLEVVIAFLAKQTLGPSPIEWIDLDTASVRCHLSRELLVRLIHQGRLPAFQDQPIKPDGSKRAKAGSSWRVCPRDLDALRPAMQGVRDASARHA